MVDVTIHHFAFTWACPCCHAPNDATSMQVYEALEFFHPIVCTSCQRAFTALTWMGETDEWEEVKHE